MSNWNSWWKTKRTRGKLFQFVKRITTAHKVHLIKNILSGQGLRRPALLELGAGSGMTTVSLLDSLGGSAVLVDAAEEAREFFRHVYKHRDNVEYIVSDVTRFNTDKKFDLAFSDGVLSLLQGKELEGFMGKHLQFLNENGLVMIIVARNSLYIRMRDLLLGSHLFYILLLKWLGVSKRSYEYEKLYTRQDLEDFVGRWNLEIITIRCTYKTICALCRKIPVYIEESSSISLRR